MTNSDRMYSRKEWRTKVENNNFLKIDDQMELLLWSSALGQIVTVVVLRLRYTPRGRERESERKRGGRGECV